MKTLLFSCFLLIVVHYSAAQFRLPDGPPDIVLGHTDEIHSVILSENRKLNIYLPDGYNPDSVATYPVIYLLDGGLDEDFIHIVGLAQFLGFPWISQLKPSIIVGIANTERKRDMTYVTADSFIWPEELEAYKPAAGTNTGGSANFIAFIEKELQPYIERSYRTNGSKTLIGQSLAGLEASEILLKKPELFTDYIIVSPSLWWGNESLLKEAPSLLKNLPDTPVNIYIAVGKEGKQMEGDAKKLAKAIKKAGKQNVQLKFRYMPDEDHGTILHHAVGDAFEWRSGLAKPQ